MAERASLPETGSSKENGRLEKPSAYLTITVPGGKRKDMRRLLKPFTKSLVCLEGYLRIQDTDSKVRLPNALTDTVPQYTVHGDEISSPSLAVMLFLPEFGSTSSENVRQHFQKFPWRHHHTIQLQKTGSSSVLGKHEFYFLSRQLPLWSVCTTPHDVSYVRFNLFVRRFNAMVEFYRLITGAEMESRKPGFSLFTIGAMRQSGSAAQPQSSCELALKYSQQVSPYPLTDAYLTFPVHDLQSLLTILPSDALPLSPRDYLVHDPDGNCLILHEIQTLETNGVETSYTKLTNTTSVHTNSVDKSSVHSDSIDSGRYSDFDVGSSEPDQCMTRLAALCKLDMATVHPRLSNVCEDHTLSLNTDLNHSHPFKMDTGRYRNSSLTDLKKTSRPEICRNPPIHKPIPCLSSNKVNDKTGHPNLATDLTHRSQSHTMHSKNCCLTINKSNVTPKSAMGGPVVHQHVHEPKSASDCCSGLSGNVTCRNAADARSYHTEHFPGASNIHMPENTPYQTNRPFVNTCCDVYQSEKTTFKITNDLDRLTSSSTPDPEELSRTRHQQVENVSPLYKVTFV